MKRQNSRSASPANKPAKVRRTGAPTSKSSDREAPAETLRISTLLWNWEHDRDPCTIDGEEPGTPSLLGSYVAGPDQELSAAGWSSEHDAFVYMPTGAGMTLRYTRKTFVGEICSSVTYYGTLAGFRDGCSIGPLLKLRRETEDPFPEKLPAVRGDDEEQTFWLSCFGYGPGPPYDFFDTDWLSSERDPSNVGTDALNLGWPDLPGQGTNDLVVLSRGDEGRDDIEEDGEECHGWRGAWVAELLDKEARNAAQDTRVEVKWCRRLWAVEVEFKPISFDAYTPPKPDDQSDTDSGEEGGDHAEPVQPNLSGYTVEATVRRVLVKPEWFESSDDENSDDESSSGGEVLQDDEDAQEEEGLKS